MKTTSIYNTYYSCYKKKPQSMIIFISLVACLFILVSIVTVKIPKTFTFEGTYSCDSICKITTIMPLEITKKIHSTDTIVIDDSKNSLKILNISPSDAEYQKIIIEIPPLNFFQNQTINFQLLQQKESLLKILLKAMKGGDIHDN